MYRESLDKVMAKSTTFDAFTKKWKEFVEKPKEIKDEDWRQFFRQKNPVAGIDRGALSNVYADKTGKSSVGEEHSALRGT